MAKSLRTKRLKRSVKKMELSKCMALLTRKLHRTLLNGQSGYGKKTWEPSVSQSRGTQRWCEYTMEAAYTRTFPTTIPSSKVIMRQYLASRHTEKTSPITWWRNFWFGSWDPHWSGCRPRSKWWSAVKEMQMCKMMKQTLQNSKSKSFKVDDMVSIKIDKVDKTTAMQPNMLIGKITAIDNKYAKVLTILGIQCRLKVSSPLWARIKHAIVEDRARNMRTSGIRHCVLGRHCYTVFRTQPQTKKQFAV